MAYAHPVMYASTIQALTLLTVSNSVDIISDTELATLVKYGEYSLGTDIDDSELIFDVNTARATAWQKKLLRRINSF